MIRTLLIITTLWLLAGPTSAQDVFTRPLVYQIPTMAKAVVKSGNVYKTVNDTTLSFDLYYPEGHTWCRRAEEWVFALATPYP